MYDVSFLFLCCDGISIIDLFMTQNIATISAGFEKGDFLVREEQGNRVYFDFFEEVSCFELRRILEAAPLLPLSLIS